MDEETVLCAVYTNTLRSSHFFALRFYLLTYPGNDEYREMDHDDSYVDLFMVVCYLHHSYIG